ncbi:MAG TPA: spore protease YyaC [Candidatus Pullilachnospira intestinigallinarum]|nr:spore protease YyaC [Candidatus Pullilachnospira intestinigallinarum]
MPGKHSVFYINERKSSASAELSCLLKKCMEKTERVWEEIIVLCIGSDRITGDSLGPLIGHQLSKYRWKNIRVYGTLDYPVHALNLEATLDKIKRRHPAALLIAVDASLGSKKHVGFITVGCGSLCPGAGVHKALPSVGDIFITGILNVSGTFEHFLLQTTRLSFVVQMAETISEGLIQTFARPCPQSRLLPDPWDKPADGWRRFPKNDAGTAALSIESSSGSIS